MIDWNDPNLIMQMMSGGLGEQAMGMGQYPTSAPGVPQVPQQAPPQAPPQAGGGMDWMNPLLGAGLGMLSAGYDSRVNPFQAALGGMTTMQAMRDRSELTKARKEEAELAREQQRAEIDAREAASKRGQRLLAMYDKKAMSDGVYSPDERMKRQLLEMQIAGGKDVSKLLNFDGGTFEGQGMEAQAMNLYLQNRDDPAWLSSPEGRLVVQRLERGIATPAGMIPGYDLNSLSGGTPSTGIPKPIPDSQRRAQYASSSLLTAEAAANDVMNSYEGFDPAAKSNIFGNVNNLLASEPFQQYKSAADEWTTNLVFIRSGATAREEEKTSAFGNYWVQPGDKGNTPLFKQMLRDQQMVNAYRQGMTNPESPVFQSPTAQAELAALVKKAAISEAMYKRASKRGEDDLPPGARVVRP